MAELEERLREITTKISQLEGKREMLLSQLKQDFGVDSVDAAKSLLEQLKQEHKTLHTEYDREYREFIDKYGDNFEAR